MDSDAGPIVEIIWCAYDLKKSIVLHDQHWFVKPAEFFTITEEFTKNTGITQSDIVGGISLNKVIDKFNESCFMNYTKENKSFCLVTYRDDLLTRMLPYQTKDLNLKLPQYFLTYFEVLTEFKKFYAQTEAINSIEDMLRYLQLSQLESEKIAMTECKNLVRIINKLSRDSHRFMNPRILDQKYNIINQNQEMTGSRRQNYKKWSAYIRNRSPEPFKNPSKQFILKLRGLPYTAREQEVLEFFRGIRVKTDNIAFLYGEDGKFTGQCYIKLFNQSDFDEALSFHNSDLGSRYIEIQEAFEDEWNAAYNSQFPDKREYYFSSAIMETIDKTVGILKLKGLQLSATEDDIRGYFAGFSLFGDNSIRRSIRNGKPSGEAFILFENQHEAERALLGARDSFVGRSVEMSLSSPKEYENFLQHNFINSAPAYSRDRMPNIPLEKRKSTLLVTGLPYEISKEEILSFFRETNIIEDEVHMINNNSGKFSGTCIIGFEDEMEAQKAMKLKNLNYIRNRYVELFEYR